jgi:hypothetical protein
MLVHEGQIPIGDHMLSRATLALLLSPALAIAQRFTASTVPLPGLGEGHNLGVPCPVDLDADGLVDLVVFAVMPAEPSGYRLVFLRRLSATGGEPRFADPVLMQMNGQPVRATGCCDSRPTAQLADLDGDGRLDLIALLHANKVEAYRGLTPTTYGDMIPLLEPDGSPLTLPDSMGAIAVADWNGDGRADLLVGTSRGVLLHAGGSNGFTAEGELRAGTSEMAERWSTPVIPTVVDWDGDGDLDLLVTDGKDTIRCFDNTGTRRQPRLAAGKPLDLGGTQRRLGPCAADWDGDGRSDLLATGHYVTQVAAKSGRPLTEPEERELAATKTRRVALEDQLWKLNRKPPDLAPEALAKRRDDRERISSALTEIKARIGELTHIAQGDPARESLRVEARLYRRP